MNQGGCNNSPFLLKIQYMDQLVLFVFTVFMGFLAIVNPLNTTPVFISVTSQLTDPKIKRKIAFRAVLYTFIIISLFCIGGKIIFQMFGITLPAFQITGGILLFAIGANLLHGQQSKIQKPDLCENVPTDNGNEGYESIAISPLAIPILAGPGAISTAMNFAGATSSLNPVWHTAMVVGVFGVICVITLISFILGDKLIKFVGQAVISVVSRIMGLIVAVIAVQMVISGITNILKIYYQNI